MAGSASLVIDIKEARGLLAGDLNGFSDPFVRLTLLDGRGNVIRGSPMLQTKVQSRTLDPTWNESFSLGTRRDGVDLRVVTTLRFMIYDYDGLLRKDTLGVVDIPVDELLPLAEDASTSGSESAALDDWFRVAQFRPEMNKDASGELHLRFQWVPSSTPASTMVDSGGPPNLLYVTVESGRDLLPMDANNSSDPFVKLSIVGQKFHTATIQKTLKPHWDERFAFLLADAHQTLEILVEDEDPTINDFLGRAELVLADHVEPGVESRVAVKLLDKRLVEDKNRGTLHLRLHWLFDANAESIAASVAKRNKDNSHSLAHKLTSKFGLLGTQQARNDDDDDDGYLLPREGEENELQDASDSEDAAAAGERLSFLTITVHRVEEMPPLDEVVFDKKRKNDAAIAGGGIDAYVAAWVSGRPEEFVKTRTYTCNGPREKLNTNFNESLMLVVPPTVSDGSEPMNVTLAIMDYDRLSTDDVVSHLELRNAVALAAQTGGKPFWWNLYGAPVVGVSDAAAMDAVNAHTTAGSTYRGRLLLSIKLQQKAAARYELRHQKRGVKKLPRELYPPSRVYRLRAHFVRGVGLPVPTGKYYLTLSCGIHEITSTQKAAVGRVVEWNETEESDRLLFPVESSQIPDVIVTLCTGEWEKRVVVSYARFPAAELLTKEFRDTTLQWIHLRADPTTGAVKPSEFPGLVMMRLALGPLESAASQIWDQRAMMEQASRRLPHQVRVRLHGLRGVGVSDVRSVHLAAYCGGEEIDVPALQLSPELETSPAVISLDVHLPLLSFSPQLLLHLKEDNKDERRLGTLALSLSDAETSKDGAPFITVCTSQQLKTNTRPQTPQPKWCPVVAASSLLELDEAPSAAAATPTMEALVSVELIRKTIPDEVLPAPEATP